MDYNEIVYKFIDDVVKQNADNLKGYFIKDARIHWHNTNESFSVDEYIIGNCQYPNSWHGNVERIEILNDLVICVAKIYTKDSTLQFHVTSFIKFFNDKIISLDEYWGDDGECPQWRKDLKIGETINF